MHGGDKPAAGLLRPGHKTGVLGKPLGKRCGRLGGLVLPGDEERAAVGMLGFERRNHLPPSRIGMGGLGDDNRVTTRLGWSVGRLGRRG